MPVSKKPRRKSSKSRAPSRSPAAQALPDRRALEGMMRGIGGRRAASAVSDAQDVMYDAWESRDRRKRIAMAHKALAISPLCADAYVLLAEEEAESAQEALDYFGKGVEAGAKAIGPKAFKEYAGHFWGFLETRPYMRARAGLAATLSVLGDVDGAISHYTEMLALNPNDNQGIRYLLASRLMKKGDLAALNKLFRDYDKDASAHWLYSRALAAFREKGGDAATANKFAKSAVRANRHVPSLLSGAAKAKPSRNGYITMGGEDEAADYVEEWGADWAAAPGAVDWLNQTAKEPAATPTQRSASH